MSLSNDKKKKQQAQANQVRRPASSNTSSDWNTPEITFTDYSSPTDSGCSGHDSGSSDSGSCSAE